MSRTTIGPVTKFGASGKIILLGEHAVVHGSRALAVALGAGVSVERHPLDGDLCELVVAVWKVAVIEGDTRSTIARAFTALVAATRLGRRSQGLLGVRATVYPELPAGGGLGSSAAAGVAVARALDPAAGDDEIVARVAAWERAFHGNPSGVDAAIAAHGGCLLFRRGQRPERLRFDARFHLAVGYSLVPSSTKAMVDTVAQRLADDGQALRARFDAIDELVGLGCLALDAEDRLGMGQLMTRNHEHLRALGVSTSTLDTMCASARSRGALGAKLTGAGGGGCVVALAQSEAAAHDLLSGWLADGFTGFVSTIGSDDPIPPGLASMIAKPSPT